MLIERTLFGDIDRVAESIDLLQTFEPPEGYYLAFSGGKDSVVIKELAIMAGVKFDAHYNMTTIDPPEVVRFIKEIHPDININRPKKSFFQLVRKKGLPTRRNRWCCSYLKESDGGDCVVITGIRGAESPRRKKRDEVEICYRDKTRSFVHPIIDWADADVWEFIKSKKLPYCKLYDDGWRRIGCIFCPFAPKKEKELCLKKYPKIARAMRRAACYFYDKKKSEGKHLAFWKDGNDMFDWWLWEPRRKKDDGPELFT